MFDIGSQLKDSDDDLAIYPNPFNGINEGIFPRADDAGLELVDGGESGAKCVRRSHDKWSLREARS